MLDNVKIYEEEGHVAFYYDSTEIYRFRNEELLQIRNEDGIQLSECMERLEGRRWVTLELKYELARIISNKFAANSFNWQEQFYSIEYNHMLNAAFEENTEPRKEQLYGCISQKDANLKALALIEFARDFTQKISHSKIRELASEKIKQYQIRN